MVDHTVTLLGEPLGARRSICAFFYNEEEEYRQLLPFCEEGLRHNDRLIQLVDSLKLNDRRRRLQSAGFDVESLENSGQLRLLAWQESFLRTGRFDPLAVLGLLEELFTEPRDDFRLIRFWANMERSPLGDGGGANHDPTIIVDYETGASTRMTGRDDVIVCSYLLPLMNGPRAMDVLRSHSNVLLGGQLKLNPFLASQTHLVQEQVSRGVGLN